jgi:hypothetical protein
VEVVEGVLGVVIGVQGLETSFLHHVQDEGEGVGNGGAAAVSFADDSNGRGAIGAWSAMVDCSGSRES